MKYRIGVFVLTILSLVTVGWAAELCQHDLMVRGGAVYLAMRGDIGAGNLEAAELRRVNSSMLAGKSNTSGLRRTQTGRSTTAWNGHRTLTRSRSNS